MNIIDISIAKGYTRESLEGAGALKGDKGEDGASVSNMAIDANGNLICTMSDGNIVNAGLIPTVTSEVETLVDEKVEEKVQETVQEQIETQLDNTIQEKVDQAIEDALGGSGDNSDVEDEIDSWF